jgi:hypothetical protein
MTIRKALLLAAPITALAAAAAGLLAGPLNPPAGAIASSYKTLDQVEPRTPIAGGALSTTTIISAPGSYYLTGNLAYSGSGAAITISAANVTLDLTGFTVSASGAAANTHGITILSPLNKNVVVRNGSVTAFPGNGLNLTGGDAHRCEHLYVSSCSGVGVVMTTFCTVTNCRITSNLGGGVSTGTAANVTDNVVDFNGVVASSTGDGINVANASTVSRNQVYSNYGNGIVATFGSVVTENSLRNCSLAGINVNFDCQVFKNNVVQCNNSNGAGYAGILVQNRCDVRDNTLSINFRHGIYISGTASTVIGNCVLGMQVTNLVGGLYFATSGSVYQNNKVNGGINFGPGVTAINDGGNTAF